MRQQISNLVERNGKYYFRCRIPKKIIGKSHNSEIRISLKTSDLQTALVSCKLIPEKLKEIFDSVENNMVPIEVIRERIAQFIKSGLDKSERYIAGYGKISPCSREAGVASYYRQIQACKEALKDNDIDIPLAGLKHSETLLEGLDYDSDDINLTARELLKAQIVKAQICINRLNGNYDDDFNNVNYAEIINRPVKTRVIVSSEIPQKIEKVLKIKDLMDKYFEEKSSSGSWHLSMKNNSKVIFETFLEINGNGNIQDVNHSKLLYFRDDVLCKLPSRMNSKPIFKGLSVLDAIKANRGETIAIKTINNRMSILGSFFKWCFIHEFIPSNPALGLTLKSHHEAHEERQLYSNAELKKIFEVLNDKTLSGTKDIHKLWVTLIAFYSGMRQGEICQLYVEDIKVIDDIVCFNITAENSADKKIKTKSGIRTVPIHPTLLHLGFLELVLERKKVGEKVQLWPKLKPNERGYGTKFERFFSNFNRKYITKDKRKVFHSLRHNFINSLKQKGVAEHKIAELIGHKIDSMTMGRYGKPFEPEPLLEAIVKLDRQINIFEILAKEPLSEETIIEQITQL